jgi:hypothetical protein
VLDATGKKLKPRNNAELFYHWIVNQLPGEYSIPVIQTALKLTQKDRKSLMNQLADPQSSLRRRLPDLVYRTTGKGRGRKSFVLVNG